MASLDLNVDGPALTAAIVDIASESGKEADLADAIEGALRPCPHLTVERIGDAVVARTKLAHAQRVVIAGHIDTVPIADNVPSRLDGEILYGCGTSDMKSGVAVALRLAAHLPSPSRDVTYVFYDCEEVEAARNGLGQIALERPELLEADFAILMEPSNGVVEAGCQGVLTVEVTARGHRAHAARAWMGRNAIHEAGQIVDRLRAYEPRQVVIDGLEYREGLNAVGVRGGVANNVIPDECIVVVNYRYAPNRSINEAYAHVHELLDEFDIAVIDSAAGALPGLDREAAAAFVAAIGGRPVAKFGWTDVSRFAALGVPAVNYGPGDPSLAHTREEHVNVARIVECERRLRDWLTSTDPRN